MKPNNTEPTATPEDLGPATFYVREPGALAATIIFSLGFAAIALLLAVGAMSFQGAKSFSYAAFAGVFLLAAFGLPVWIVLRSRRKGRIVIDPVCGEIRLSPDHAVPFSQVRQVEVVLHEYTFVGAELEGGSYSSDITGWGIDIGAGTKLFAESGLSHERVVEIADALKIRVEAFRARTGATAAPLPRPGSRLLERLALSLHYEGETFEENWLSLNGPIVELMREFNVVPDAQTMGQGGEFAQALRKAGFHVGEAPSSPPKPAPRS